jgi:hypothetical protein
MKAKLIKLGFLTYLLLTNFILFAKDSGGDILDDGNVEQDIEAPPVFPINAQLIWLLVLGFAFAFHLYKTKKVKV